MLCTNQGHRRTVMKPLLQNTAGQQISTVQPLHILAKYHNTDAPIHSLYKQHDYVCGCCQSDSVLSRTGAQGGVLVWLTVMMSRLWAQPANQGLLQRRTENYSPFPHSISSLPLSLSVCLSAYSSLYLLSHLSFLNTPTLLPFSIPFFSLSHPPLVLPHRQHASAWKENLSRHRDNNKAEFCFVWFCSTQQSKHSKSTNLQVYCKTVINK